MIKLKSLILESVETLTPKDIYNFYYLYSLKSWQPDVFKTEYGDFILNEYVKSFKQKYLKVFKKLMYQQLVKYVGRGRIDPDFPKDMLAQGEALSTKELLELMMKTFRSDMTRRNKVWIEAGEFLDKLQHAGKIDDMLFWVDQLNSAIHNTKTLMLGKESPLLMSALLKAQSAKSIGELDRFVDKDLRGLRSQETFEGVDTEFFHGPPRKIGGQNPGVSSPSIYKPTPIKKDDEEELNNREKELKYGALQEDVISATDRNNADFMAGFKLGVKDKAAKIDRDIKGSSQDFIRGYKTVERPGVWAKWNTQLTRWLGDLGSSLVR